MASSDIPWGSRRISRRALLSRAAIGAAVLTPIASLSPSGLGFIAHAVASARPSPASEFDAAVPSAWFALMLRLIRQTPGYSPPVASRALGCAGVSLYEAILPGMPDHLSLSHAINGLPPMRSDGRNAAYHWPSVANATLAQMARNLFPTAPASLQAEIDALETGLVSDVPLGVRERSVERGRAIAGAIHDWSKSDGGHEGYLRNFPTDYDPPTGPGSWVPTLPTFQRALQPRWGANRCMALSTASACDPGPHPPFSTAPDSAFFAEAVEVYDAVNSLTAEQRAIALFWSDDPGMTATPPGHSLSILTQILRAQDRSLADAAEAYAKLGIAVCDAFIACWQVKYAHNLLRPITYIRDTIDPGWGDPLPLTTPPFPEFTSGHSVQSAAAAKVLTALFGAMPFTDRTHEARGLPARSFASFDAFADEAAVSRLYGGIHFRSAIDRGLAQGTCIGSTVAALTLLR
jgi:hypothetical protein